MENNSRCSVDTNLRPDFTSKLVHVLAFGTPKFYIAPYDKIKHEFVNLSSNCDVKSDLRLTNFYFMQDSKLSMLGSIKIHSV